MQLKITLWSGYMYIMQLFFFLIPFFPHLTHTLIHFPIFILVDIVNLTQVMSSKIYIPWS